MKLYSAIVVFLVLICASIVHAERMAISVDVANIRSGPGAKYDIIWKVEKLKLCSYPFFLFIYGKTVLNMGKNDIFGQSWPIL